MSWMPDYQWTDAEFDALKLCWSQLEGLGIEKEAALRVALRRVLGVDVLENEKLFERPEETNLQGQYMERIMSMVDMFSGMRSEPVQEEAATSATSGQMMTINIKLDAGALKDLSRY